MAGSLQWALSLIERQVIVDRVTQALGRLFVESYDPVSDIDLHSLHWLDVFPVSSSTHQ